ncbi:MAG: hypothetical protein LBV75_02600 [Paludibacter sp.]|jgi:hypothetical protein|nr:hypothetical protein [Paludibacter sp.]
MKKIFLILCLLPLSLFAQVTDDFSDGDFTQNPTWTGTAENFIVNPAFQLQSNALAASTSYLATPSQAIDNAVWEFWVRIEYPTSSSNYASVYLVSDRADFSGECNGYYVQIGNTNDEISLYLQQGATKTKIIDGADRRADTMRVAGQTIYPELQIRITRDGEGNFALYSKNISRGESDFYLEGTTKNIKVTSSEFFGLLFRNSGATGKAYFFDDIAVSGDKTQDITPPTLTKFEMRLPNEIFMQFSEAMKYENADFEIDNGIGKAEYTQITSDKTAISLFFDRNFEQGVLYTIYFSGLSDLAGNFMDEGQKVFGIVETPETEDVTWNEIMFDSPAGSQEYLEIANRSDKLIDASKLCFATRNAAGKLTTARHIPAGTYLFPHDVLAFCANPDSVSSYYNLPPESHIVQTAWTSLNNESATVALFITENADTVILDEFTYSAKWHHSLIKNKKGVALEKINPALSSANAESWHSAATSVNYGTPGYQNSQFRQIDSDTQNEKFIRLEPSAFSPDNDGVDDLLFINYNIGASGFVANVVIYSATGVKVKQLAYNALLQSEGYITWDGSNDRNTIANSGVYVLMFEAFNPDTGQKKSQKLPIAVSTR